MWLLTQALEALGTLGGMLCCAVGVAAAFAVGKALIYDLTNKPTPPESQPPK